MPTAAKEKLPTRLANGRVSADTLEEASKVLERHGLTVSAFIRNSLDYVARTGEVPDLGSVSPRATVTEKQKKLAAFFRKVESESSLQPPEPEGLDDDEIRWEAMKERYGY